MFKQRPPPPAKGKKAKAPTDMGMFAIPDLSSLGVHNENMDDDDDEDVGEDDLENELMVLLSGKAPARKQAKPDSKQAAAFNIQDIAKMANQVLEDIDDDEDTSEADDAILNDPKLLKELEGLASDSEDTIEAPAPQPPPPISAPAPPPSSSAQVGGQLEDVIRARIHNYQEAERAAKELGESAKVRRYGRAIKTLESQLKGVQKGQRFSEDEIPPPVAVPKAKPTPSQPPPTLPPIDSLTEPPSREEALPELPAAPLRPAPQVPSPMPSSLQAPPPPPRTRGASLPSPRTEAKVSKLDQPGPSTSTAVSKPSTSRPAPPPPAVSAASSSQASATTSLLQTRREQYRHAALKAKTLGDTKNAINFMRTAKQFEAVLNAMESGKPVDLSNMPPAPPAQYLAPVAAKMPTPNAPTAPPRPAPNLPQPKIPDPSTATTIDQNNPTLESLLESNEPDDPSLYNAPPPPSTVLEALTQRLEKYKSTQAAAQEEGNSSKARRIGRIVKQYEDAIKFHKAGRPVDYDSLPTPPGFGPIPSQSSGDSPAKPSSKQPSQGASPITSSANNVAPPPQAKVAAPQQPKAPATSQAAKVTSSSGHTLQKTNSIQERQLSFLMERYQLFKQAALDSKRKGDIEQAKDYLRKAKGLEPMIEASKCGLPIDATTIPTPPQLEDQFVVVEADDLLDTIDDKDEMFRKLERELQHQIEICERNKQHFLKLGDVSSASKFEKLAVNTGKDLAVVRNLWKRGDKLPRFHYETREMSIVQSNPDLSSTELEVKVIRGIDLPDRFKGQVCHGCLNIISSGKSNELDTYVRVEFPLPSDNPPKFKSSTVRDTTNPEFNQAFKFEINRTRSLVNRFKRASIKCEVWQKGGFFRGDTLLGTAQVRLVDLEKQCTVHNSFDLMLNRRPVGGKLEVLVRIREPLVSQQVEEIRERWLVIG